MCTINLLSYRPHCPNHTPTNSPTNRTPHQPTIPASTHRRRRFVVAQKLNICRWGRCTLLVPLVRFVKRLQLTRVHAHRDFRAACRTHGRSPLFSAVWVARWSWHRGERWRGNKNKELRQNDAPSGRCKRRNNHNTCREDATMGGFYLPYANRTSLMSNELVPQCVQAVANAASAWARSFWATYNSVL